MTFSIYPLIHHPTRITEHSVTLLDNIFTNDFPCILSGVILADVSDHLPVFCICRNSKVKGKSLYFYKRQINEANIVKFNTHLKDIIWRFDAIDSNHSYELFLHQCLNVYDECFPLQKIIIKQKRVNKPWITKEISKKIKKKWMLYKKYIKNPSDYRHTVYKQYRNMVTNEIRKAKYEYYKVKFDNDKGNMKAMWKTINHALGIHSSKKMAVDKINIDGVIIDDKNEISELFVNIGLNLTNDMQYSDRVFNRDFEFNEQTAYFTPITCKEIIDIVIVILKMEPVQDMMELMLVL